MNPLMHVRDNTISDTLHVGVFLMSSPFCNFLVASTRQSSLLRLRWLLPRRTGLVGGLLEKEIAFRKTLLIFGRVVYDKRSFALLLYTVLLFIGYSSLPSDQSIAQ